MGRRYGLATRLLIKGMDPIYGRTGSFAKYQVLELVARMDTRLGAQPYELTLTSPRGAWLASRAAFSEAMNAFTPRS